MGVVIKDISYFLPENSLTHEELCRRFGFEVMEKIVGISGIKNRRVVDSKTCASDLAFNAAEKLFENSSVKKEEIDLLIMATQSPDYILPTTACILQDRLGLKKTCAAFDINLGCSQFIYALGVANAWLKSGMAKKVLVLTADTPSRTINPLDRSAVTLFGDAACALILEDDKSAAGIIDFDFGTDGSGFTDLIIPASGFRTPPSAEDYITKEDENGNVRSNANLYVNGFRIFAFAYKVIADSVNALLSKNNLKIEDIDLFIFHQAGEKIVRSAAERLKIPESKLFFNMAEIGNCGGSSVGIAFADAKKAGLLKKGSKVVLCAFGVGLSWGSVLINI